MPRLRRLYVAELPAAGGAVELPRESLEHVHVLRLNAGAEVELFDGRGGSARAELTSVTRSRASCLAQPPSAAVKQTDLQLIVCLPKAGKLETVVRMTTELGVSALHLAQSERSVPKPSGDAAKLDRLRRVAREACAQSGQPFVPELHAPSPLALCAARAAPNAHKLLFWEQASAPLPAALRGEVWAVIGPEGGLSAEEAEILRANGYAAHSLGSHILRAETACVVITALLLDRLRAHA